MAFSIGPQVGLNVAGATNASTSNTTLTYRAGFEVGLQGVLQFKHLAVQPLPYASPKKAGTATTGLIWAAVPKLTTGSATSHSP
jgi:hypothetical protein